MSVTQLRKQFLNILLITILTTVGYKHQPISTDRANFNSLLVERTSSCIRQVCNTAICTVETRDLRIFEIRFEFESDASDSIRFESDGHGRTCRHTTNYSHCSTKTYNRCAVVIEIYFMFIILAKRDYVTFD